MLKVKNISKHFDGIKALDAVSLSAKPGEITGLIGPNGSGKSTLINVLTNMLGKSGGEIINRENFSRTFQDSRLWSHVTVSDTIYLATKTRNVFASLCDFSYKNKEMMALLSRVELEHHAHTEARHLSYGQRKLLELARALAGDTKVLFLDEPFAGLFPEIIEKIKAILIEEKNNGKTIILIEHDMAIIKELCDYVYVLDSGRNIAEGSPADVLNNKEVMKAYLGE